MGGEKEEPKMQMCDFVAVAVAAPSPVAAGVDIVLVLSKLSVAIC